MDYYSILGVPKHASDKELKSAYKKLSMQHHPDRTGGSDEKFKQVNEAYSTLKDPQKRAAYDNPQPQGFGPNGFQGNTTARGFEDMFASMFGAGFHQRQQQQRRNRDIQLHYKLTLEDCFSGKLLNLQYTLPSGRQEQVEVRIPAGVRNGDNVRIDGWGDDSIPNIPRGNLLVNISVMKAKGWDVHGLDLIYSINVSVMDLILGCEVIINSPERKMVNLKIPKGTNPETTFSINGYGLPDNRSGRRGSIFVKVKGVTPQVTDEILEHQIKALKEKIEK
jgi:DnaJ-class molecular chaperone